MNFALKRALRGIRAACVALAIAAPPVVQSAAQYAITDLGTFGGPTSAAYAINDLGQVVGAADLTNTSPIWEHAFLYTNGVMTDLGVLGNYVIGFGTYSTSIALGMNNLGQIVGKSYTTAGRFHAFLYDQGQMTDLGVLPANDQSQARSINDSGQIIGATEPSGPVHGFLYENGTMADLGTLGGTYSSAYAIYNHSQIVGDINDNGQITGYAGTGGDSTTMMRGFLYSNGVMTDLGNLGNPLTNVVPLAINNKGQIVGNISGYSTSSHAFLYNSSTMSLLDNLIDPGSGWNLVHDAAAITGSRFYRAVQP